MENLTLGTSQTYTNDYIYNMTSERIKEIQQVTAYPKSRSVHKALLQVWNECEQDKKIYSEEEVVKFGQWLSEFNNLDNESEYVIKELLRRFKNK